MLTEKVIDAADRVSLPLGQQSGRIAHRLKLERRRREQLLSGFTSEALYKT